MEIHVVNKLDNGNHATCIIGSEPSGYAASLGQSSIRARPFLLSLSSNNLSYARGGDHMHWWDAFPVPKDAPAPYNDQKSWGIVPAWGFAVVVETRITALPLGTVLWGFWPTATMTTNLQLQAGALKGDWVEASEQRQKLLTIYNEYSEQPAIHIPPSSLGFGDQKIQEMAWEALFRPTWQTGYLLNQHVFPPKSQASRAVDPTGAGQMWSEDDADLSRAILVSLSASGKTARCFAYHVFQRPPNSGPLGFLQVTMSTSLISDVPQVLQTSIPTRAVAYPDISTSMSWMADLMPSKIVIVDFGTRADVLNQFIDLINRHNTLTSTRVVILQVGNQQKVYTPQEAEKAMQEMSNLGILRFNSVRVRDAAIQSNGAEDFNASVQPVWEDWLRISHSIMPDIRITVGQGISGADGVEGGWDRLSKGLVGAQEGLVYELPLPKD
ncbi:hypothetical protein GQ53DRAFT_793943 [Thozetella sp. PMI_491]|nr:hypothetical protein GQ53DRAFT_793943 [Thozetella sp. PMI_491]